MPVLRGTHLEHKRLVQREIEQRRADAGDDEGDIPQQRTVPVENVRVQRGERAVPIPDLAGEGEHRRRRVPSGKQNDRAVKRKTEHKEVDHKAHQRGGDKAKERRLQKFENDLIDLRGIAQCVKVRGR